MKPFLTTQQVLHETFRSKERRDNNRRIRILFEISPLPGQVIPRYRYEVVTNDGNPKVVGRTGRISAQTLSNESKWEKVSH